MIRTNNNDPRPCPAEGREEALAERAVLIVARPALAVLDCSCGRSHHLPHGRLGALAEDCKPELVEVGR